MNAEFLPFKEEHYKADEYRKIKDKYRDLKKEVVNFMNGGNKSKGEGELSTKFKAIEKIIKEANTHEIEKTSKKESEQAEKTLIQETGDRIVKQRTVKRDVGKIVYHLDGTVTDNRIHKKAPRFEDYLYKRLSSNDDSLDEIATEEKMHAWIAFKGFNVEHLFTELNIEMIPDSCSFKSQINQSLDIFRALGLKSIVNVFCQNGKKFHADYFRERLTAVSVHEFLNMKMFPILESWRKN